jgi:hypothetical protein
VRGRVQGDAVEHQFPDLPVLRVEIEVGLGAGLGTVEADGADRVETFLPGGHVEVDLIADHGDQFRAGPGLTTGDLSGGQGGLLQAEVAACGGVATKLRTAPRFYGGFGEARRE